MGIFKKAGSLIRGVFGRTPAGDHGTNGNGNGASTRTNGSPGAKNLLLKKNGVFKKSTPRTFGDTPEAIDEPAGGPVGQYPIGRAAQLVSAAPWYTLISSNVDRIRYGQDDRHLHVIFKDGSMYEYDDVEPTIFMAFLRAPSPGQYVHYVLIQYGYAYRKLSGGHAVSAPAADRFSGEPYAVSEEIQAIQDAAGRKPAEGRVNTSAGGVWNYGTPVSGKNQEPPPAWTGKR